jgi:hypothetical protein
MSVFEFIIRNFRGAFIVVLTRGGWFDFGEVVDGSGIGNRFDSGNRFDTTSSGGGIIGLLNMFGTDYVVADAIDIFF